MKLEDQVCSLELAKKLKELGVKQDGLFAWFEEKDKKRIFCEYRLHQQSRDSQDTFNDGYAATPSEICSAPTVAELDEMLPFNYTVLKHISMEKWFGVEFFMGGTAKPIGISAKTGADARAKMVIYFLEKEEEK